MTIKEYREFGIKLSEELIKLIPIISSQDHYEGRENAKKTEKEWIRKFPDTFIFEGKEAKIAIPEEDDRSWIDFSIAYKEEFFPYNFKSASGATTDNIGGLKYIPFLIFNEREISYNEKNLTTEIIRFEKEEKVFDSANRDYFLICYCTKDSSTKIIPLLCIGKDDLKTNPKNLFQANFHTAKIDLDRSLSDGIDMIIEKFIEYQAKRAGCYLILKDEGIIQEQE
ncbi:hypothetical protein KKC63_02950 [Patescibacteria group bacterium]|nr:hypothetical protein [Patescibacteria group bacterium]MBU4023233.1 hypothetical protein [Patescibacteria group bacterium]MBU4078423.1 hypothetical protein [Patescibacteria group bacterium]